MAKRNNLYQIIVMGFGYLMGFVDYKKNKNHHRPFNNKVYVGT